MNKLLLFVLFVFPALTGFGQKNTTVEDVADFTIYGTNTSLSGNNSAISVTLSLKGIYRSKSDSLILKSLTRNDTVMIATYPLKFDFFQTNFKNYMDTAYNCTTDYHSILEVFYWIVSLSEEKSTQPIAGQILTNQYVQVSDFKNPRTTQEDRLTFISKEITAIDVINSKINQLKNEAVDSNIIFVKGKDDTIRLAKVKFSDIIGENYIGYSTNAKSNVEVTINEATADSSLLQHLQSHYTLNSKKDFYKIWGKKEVYFVNDSITAIIETIKKLQENYNQGLKKLASFGIYPIEKVDIQIERGFIERIQVTIIKPEQKEIYENLFPIGFSSIPNFRDIKDTRLFPRTQGKKNWEHVKCIYLSDVIQNYDNQLDISTKDYSPGDTVVTIAPLVNPSAKLYKQKSIYILDGKTFTDINGFNEKSPNGLVQVELSRRFNINTYRKQVHNSINIGVFGYLNTQVNFSKIENKLKGLPLRNEMIVENKAVISPSYASNLDFMRYENLSIRLEPNILTYDVPHYKLTYYLDLGIKYGHTPITDSIYQVSNTGTISGEAVDLDAHSFTLYPKVAVELFAERRYGVKGSYQANFSRILSNNNFKQVVSYSGKGNDLESLSINPTARWSHTVELFAYFDPTPNSGSGKVFAKACFHFQYGDINTFYPQLLLGYAFNLFK